MSLVGINGTPLEVIAALDHGTTTTSWTYFDRRLNVLASHTLDHQQICPKPGWVEHDPIEIFNNVKIVLKEATRKLRELYASFTVLSLGVASQRETIVTWNPSTGMPYYKAIVWLDTRTGDIVKELCEKYGGTEAFRPLTGLPFASYFSGVKLRWLLENVPGLADQLQNGGGLIGTMDSWLLWNLTGGVGKGIHSTDITNASRTMLLDLHTMKWSTKMREIFLPNIPLSCLPTIRSSAEKFGCLEDFGISELKGVPICGVAGDQLAACVGHGMFQLGQIKCTYGTGASVILITGSYSPLESTTSGNICTPCCQFGALDPVQFALEGSVAVAGGGITWLKDNLEALETTEEAEALLTSVDDTGGVYFVPAFAGLFAPRWREDARGGIFGITQHTTKAHIVRALIESIGFQLQEILTSMYDAVKDELKGIEVVDIRSLNVDGEMCSLVPSCIQVSADIINKVIEMPVNVEATSVGAAMLAGVGCGIWEKGDLESLHKSLPIITWTPRTDQAERDEKFKRWQLAVSKSLNCSMFGKNESLDILSEEEGEDTDWENKNGKKLDGKKIDDSPGSNRVYKDRVFSVSPIRSVRLVDRNQV